LTHPPIQAPPRYAGDGSVDNGLVFTTRHGTLG
jgi:hypothetical protein